MRAGFHKTRKNLGHFLLTETGIIYPFKLTKDNNSRYFPILNGLINTLRGRERYKNTIFLDNGCSYMIVGEDSRKNLKTQKIM